METLNPAQSINHQPGITGQKRSSQPQHRCSSAVMAKGVG